MLSFPLMAWLTRKQHRAAVLSLAFPEHETLVSGSYDRYVRGFDLRQDSQTVSKTDREREREREREEASSVKQRISNGHKGKGREKCQ